jgi:xanthine/uracil/vitamin C permease (AzgA family)
MTLAVGMLSNLPVAIGPGLALATTFGTLVKSTTKDGSLQPNRALGLCMVAGIMIILLSALQVPQRLFERCPLAIKQGLPVGLGLFLSLLGMKQLGVIGEEDGHLHFDSFEILLGSASFIVMAFLEVGTAETPCLLLCLRSFSTCAMLFQERKSKWSFAIPIIMLTALGWVTGAAQAPVDFFQIPSFEWKLDFFVDTQAVLHVLSIILISILDSGGIMFTSK